MIGALPVAVPAVGRTLSAGAGQEFALPSRAIAAAQSGDTVLIEPGEYYDCATVQADGLTIAGRAPGVVLTDTTCGGKAILVIRGADTTVRDLSLSRARVPDGNGAGIRLEGQGLLLERVVFDNDQVGVLAGAGGPGTIRVVACRFTGGGTDARTAALHVDAVAALHVDGSVFAGGQGTAIASAAGRTAVTGSTFETRRTAVATSGGLSLEGNSFALLPGTQGRPAAVQATGDGAVSARRNRLLNQTGEPAVLLLDWTGGTPVFADNQVGPGDRESGSDGVWRHRAGDAWRGAKDGVRHALGSAKRLVTGR